MCALAHAKSFRDLLVYQKAKALAQEIFTISRSFPKEETFSLTDQVRRSSRSVGAQIAEAWAKRRYEKHFISKLTDADGEQQETQHWIETAFDCGYLSQSQNVALLARYAEIGRLLGGMIAKAESFCNPEALSIHEERAEYFTEH
jgi:four helix bundle protein